MGGLGFTPHLNLRHAAFTSSFLTTWPTILRVLPAAATLAHAPPGVAPSPLLAELTSSLTFLRNTLHGVRTRYALLDAIVYHSVDGSTSTAFHPYLNKELDIPDPESLSFDTASTLPRLSQASLAAVIHSNSWLLHLDACAEFDSKNTDASVSDRETRRHISASATGSGHWLHVTVDNNVRPSRIDSSHFVSATQYRVGLEISSIAPLLRSRHANGYPVTDSDRLGDSAVNDNTTARHNATNHALYTAITSATGDSVRRGDKGNSARLRRRALRRYAFLNEGHVPDIIRVAGAVTTLYETKCINPLKASGALGRGSHLGGKPSQAAGNIFSFGCSYEHERWVNLGCKARGTPGTEAFRHDLGTGFVAKHSGCYADALSKGHRTSLLVTEALSGVHRDVSSLIHHLSQAPPGTDTTEYGSARSATRSFYTHHLRLVSLAIAIGVAKQIDVWAAKMTLGPIDSSPPPVSDDSSSSDDDDPPVDPGA
jgi:hypothetical protein